MRLATGGDLWAERHDGEMSDVIRVQDQETRKIITALAVNLTQNEEARQTINEADNPQAHHYLLRGKQLLSGVLSEGVFERPFDFQLERFRRFMTEEQGGELILSISADQVAACAP